MKAIILAGGTGSRLHPLTRAVNKHLLPVAGTPMIFHPLALLMRAGIRELFIVTTPRDREDFVRLLGDGTQWGVSIAFAEQAEPLGVPHAISLAREWSAGEQVCVMLGDNIFIGNGIDVSIRRAWQSNHGAHIFSCTVDELKSYGVVITDSLGKVIGLVEKPTDAPIDACAIPGLYVYDPQIFSVIDELSKNSQGQADVTDLNRWYWLRGMLAVEPLGEGTAWCDAGTHETLARAIQMVESEEKRTGRRVACLEEIALEHGWIKKAPGFPRFSPRGNESHADCLRGTSIDAETGPHP